MTTWQARVSDDEMRRRTGGHNKYNALRTMMTRLRREAIIELVHAWGVGPGIQKKIAAALQVHPSVISRNFAALARAVPVCPTCGALRPRHWADD